MVEVKRKCQQCYEVRNMPENRKVCGHCRRLNHFVNTDDVRPPDYEDTTVDKYKEPMESVKNGFGYIGAITETKDGKLIQCHVCGYFFSRLGNHTSRHNMTQREYKIKFGLRIKDGLLSPEMRKKAQEVYNKDVRKDERLEKLSAGLQKRREKGQWRTGGAVAGYATKDTPQTRNEQGTCRAQTLAKIIRLSKMVDGPIIYKDFIREYGGSESIEHWFGSWDKALEAANIETYQARRGRRRHEVAVSIPKLIKAFYKKNKRVPQSSDFNSVNGLPSQAEVSRVYGTLNNARVAAGVPQLVHVGYGIWEEVE